MTCKICYFLENKIHKILWDFELQTDHQFRLEDQAKCSFKKRKKRTCRVDFPADRRVNIKESEKIDKYLPIAEKALKHGR